MEYELESVRLLGFYSESAFARLTQRKHHLLGDTHHLQDKANNFLRRNLALPGTVTSEEILSTVWYSQHIMFSSLTSNRRVILELLLYNSRQCRLSVCHR